MLLVRPADCPDVELLNSAQLHVEAAVRVALREADVADFAPGGASVAASRAAAPREADAAPAPPAPQNDTEP